MPFICVCSQWNYKNPIYEFWIMLMYRILVNQFFKIVKMKSDRFVHLLT